MTVRLQDLIAGAGGRAPSGRASLAGRRFRLLGLDESVTACDLCGKQDLKCTMALEELDAEGNVVSDEPVYYGRDCGAFALGWGVSADRAEKLIRGEARVDYERLYPLWRDVQVAAGGAATEAVVELDGVRLRVRDLYGRKAPPASWGPGWGKVANLTWKVVT